MQVKKQLESINNPFQETGIDAYLESKMDFDTWFQETFIGRKSQNGTSKDN